MKFLEEEMKEHFMVNIMGKSKKGHPIKLYTFGNSTLPKVLLYGLPDPGEVVGSSAILGLMRALKDPNHYIHYIPVQWNFIPLVNIDDQPDDGLTLSPTSKNSEQEVDWMMDRPRPETNALISICDLINPIFVFPMHDEFNTTEIQDCYIPVGRELPPEICQTLTSTLNQYGLKITKDIVDQQMGEGFLNIHNVQDIYRSTFSHFAKNALVLICEVPRLEENKYKDLMAAQLACAFIVISHLIKDA